MHPERINAIVDLLNHISNYPANGNSDPDTMAAALDDVKQTACTIIEIIREEQRK